VSSYETVVGLEVHIEMSTRTKVWCQCRNEFGAEPNTHVCPVCLALPGSLPVLNEEALALVIKAGLALGCQVSHHSRFDRKNYFYPDSPMNYQITQFDHPICHSGHVEIETPDGGTKRVRIREMHLENDAGKSLHDDQITGSDFSLLDFNRAGVPLVEIVSEPDLRGPEDVKAYLNKLRSIIKYAGVSDVKMEEGSMRCDVSVSVRPAGSEALGTRVEIKNVNSISAAMRAVEYEAKRQVRLVEAGEGVLQETRSWQDARGVSVFMRSKEDAHDYRYFPEPDLPPVAVTDETVERLRRELPELPDARKARLVGLFGLSVYDASVIVAEKPVADFFDEAVSLYANPKLIANWVTNDLARVMNDRNIAPEAIPITPRQLVALLRLMEKGTITGKIAKTVFDEMVESGKDPELIVKEKGLVQVADEGELAEVAREVIQANPKVVEDWKAGKAAAAQFLVGQMMKATRGRANPQLANRLIIEELKKVTGQT
jgi:aspartyl-tRNA(Asn)/glutamyl-tRNA(Gln) amidotransferase subunit B